MNTSPISSASLQIVSCPLSQSEQITLAAAFCAASESWELIPS